VDIKPGQIWRNRAAKEELEVLALTKKEVILSNGNSTTHAALLEWWDLVRDVPRGPTIITAVSHNANAPYKYAREMTPGELYAALEVWINAGYLDEGPEFDAKVKQMKRRVKAELKRRGLPKDRLLWEQSK
jgi:hypothetical protein